MSAKLAGWTAIAIALLALVPSLVPGAGSLFGLMLSMLALGLSLFSIRKKGRKYVQITTLIVLAGVFFVNDSLRIWAPIPMPLDFRLGLYCIVFFVAVGCMLIAYRLQPGQSDLDKPVEPNLPPKT